MKLIKQVLLFFIVFVPFVLTLDGGATTYEWVDDGGVVHFTDNPDRVPDKYIKRVKMLDRYDSVEKVQSPATQAAPAAEKPAGLYGGYDERSWRKKFVSLNAEIKEIEDALGAKREKLNQLRRNRIIYQRTRDRVAYNNLDQEIGKDEARIRELQLKLQKLTADADNAGVPAEWR